MASNNDGPAPPLHLFLGSTRRARSPFRTHSQSFFARLNRTSHLARTFLCLLRGTCPAMRTLGYTLVAWPALDISFPRDKEAPARRLHNRRRKAMSSTGIRRETA